MNWKTGWPQKATLQPVAAIRGSAQGDAVPQQIWSGPTDRSIDYCNEQCRPTHDLEELQSVFCAAANSVREAMRGCDAPVSNQGQRLPTDISMQREMELLFDGATAVPRRPFGPAPRLGRR
jgi:hypothetical protein